MNKVLLALILVIVLVQPVSATITAPDVPDSGASYMPADTETFGEGLWFVIRSAIAAIKPSIKSAAGSCVTIMVAVLLASTVQNVHKKTGVVADICTAVGIGIVLLQPSNTLINLGVAAVDELTAYGKLLIPVMTSAMAAQGGFRTSAALYTGTTVLMSLLSVLMAKLIVPLVYIYLCLVLANGAVGEDILQKLQDLIKCMITWMLKIAVYVFTGYISITGAVGGSTDASMLKATKLAISGSVPVVGGILSDASETVLIGAGMMKNAAGVYGMLAIIATWIGPFLEVGVHYLLLKLTASVCAVFGTKRMSDMVNDFSVAMGFVMAMVSTISILLLVGVVCFMKGVS